MRLFLAIDLPDKIKVSLDGQLTELRKKFPDFMWVDKNNYHVTLLFLGESNDQQKIIEKVKAMVYDQEHFYLYSTLTDLFMKNKITIYLEFRRERKIEELVGAIKKSLMVVDNNKYIPHLTLARCRIPSKQQYFVLKKTLHRQNLEIEFPVKKFYLFESILTNKKASYKKLASFNLI